MNYLQKSFEVHGFTTMHWNMLPQDVRWRTFRWRHYDGLLRIEPGMIEIVGLLSQQPGSGKLGLLMGQFERVAADNSCRVQVVSIWNKRLGKWLKRRGYVLRKSAERGLHAEWSVSGKGLTA